MLIVCYYKLRWRLCVLYKVALDLFAVFKTVEGFFVLVARECGPHHFQCPQGVCISENWLCDGKKDCPNGADEDKVMCCK